MENKKDMVVSLSVVFSIIAICIAGYSIMGSPGENNEINALKTENQELKADIEALVYQLNDRVTLLENVKEDEPTDYETRIKALEELAIQQATINTELIESFKTNGDTLIEFMEGDIEAWGNQQKRDKTQDDLTDWILDYLGFS